MTQLAPTDTPSNFIIKSFSRIDDIPKDDWNALIEDGNPFTHHEFLSALEKHQCVGKAFGWLPRHLAIFQDKVLVGALPVYEKHNNYGEFVFDQAWDEAWKSVGLAYYPKLVSAVPYTPAMGQRILFNANHTHADKICDTLLAGLQSLCIQTNMSGCHILFTNKQQQSWLTNQPELLFRQDCQFHWFNQNYTDFDDFLSQLTSKKRKNIKQERRAVAEQGITFRVLDGKTATEQDWQDFTLFYNKTFNEKWGTPTLNKAFFMGIAKQLPESIVLVLADKPVKKIEEDQRDASTCIAGALMFRSKTHLYGRHWGCIENVHCLHFETCFYQGIEYAIKEGINVFEPGAGGEHKIARGFSPVSIQSAHWLAQNPFSEEIDQFIAEEKNSVDEYAIDCETRSPYRLKPKTYVTTQLTP